ncbi:unnamed protein product [Urochloa humidicola]
MRRAARRVQGAAACGLWLDACGWELSGAKQPDERAERIVRRRSEAIGKRCGVTQGLWPGESGRAGGTADRAGCTAAERLGVRGRCRQRSLPEYSVRAGLSCGRMKQHGTGTGGRPSIYRSGGHGAASGVIADAGAPSSQWSGVMLLNPGGRRNGAIERPAKHGARPGEGA